ncbi:hypothetical protein M409DRAFT_58000 [Zasmidium cellare ATCC 36951]|uniref:Uncharacterized protein n=1 Tax=Zasmidium cellare ATCC 36951 TaxID=1080233 RepID=A0A6A6C7Y2_ZASCE|nr:uncharacterized protein M409DRAFT_58000 [Zasmidium cellare ATCC 36951]KAF2162963.1 hypothetical protein M409DRAFT_58000 [Zasmidium cellare ATCC 36951]
MCTQRLITWTGCGHWTTQKVQCAQAIQLGPMNFCSTVHAPEVEDIPEQRCPDTRKHPSVTGKKPYHVQLWELRFGGEVRTCERRTVDDLPEEFWALLEDDLR